MKDVNALCVCVIITRVMLECRCPDMTRTKREPFIRALRVPCKTCRPNSEASYVGRVLLFLVYVSGRVYSAKTSLFGLFHFEAFIRHHHVPVSEGFNSHHDSVKPLFHSPLLDRLKRHLELARSRSASYLSFKLILYPNSDSTSQLTRLTTSGDSSLNPGPERCSVCGNSVETIVPHPATPANFSATSSAAYSHQGSLKGFNHSKTSTEFSPFVLACLPLCLLAIILIGLFLT